MSKFSRLINMQFKTTSNKTAVIVGYNAEETLLKVCVDCVGTYWYLPNGKIDHKNSHSLDLTENPLDFLDVDEPNRKESNQFQISKELEIGSKIYVLASKVAWEQSTKENLYREVKKLFDSPLSESLYFGLNMKLATDLREASRDEKTGKNIISWNKVADFVLKREIKIKQQAPWSILSFFKELQNHTLEIFRHKARKSKYYLIGIASAQAEKPISEGDEVCVYASVDNETLWIRPKEEFFDGRFEKINSQEE